MRSKVVRFFGSPSIRRRALSVVFLSMFARSKPIRSNTPNVVGRRVEVTRSRLLCPALRTMLIRTPQFLFVGLSGNLEFIRVESFSNGPCMQTATSTVDEAAHLSFSASQELKRSGTPSESRDGGGHCGTRTTRLGLVGQ